MRHVLYIAPLVSAFLLSTALGSEGWGNSQCGSLDRVVTAIHLAEVLYPEIKGKELSLQFSVGTGGPLSNATDVRSLLITADKPQWHPPKSDSKEFGNMPHAHSPENNVAMYLPLYLNFDFVNYGAVEKGNTPDLACRPLHFRNDVASPQMQQARAIINAHPQWTDDQDLEAARKLGLRYGPAQKAELLKQLPLHALSAFYGPLRIKSAKFLIAGNSTKEGSFAELRWYLTAEPEGTSRHLLIFVEPFHGKIDAISE